MCINVSEICTEGIFVSFPWWLEDVKSRSTIASFFEWEPFWNLFSKNESNYIFEKKIIKNYIKTTQPNYNFCKTRSNKSKQWTHYSNFNDDDGNAIVTILSAMFTKSLTNRILDVLTWPLFLTLQENQYLTILRRVKWIHGLFLFPLVLGKM